MVESEDDLVTSTDTSQQVALSMPLKHPGNVYSVALVSFWMAQGLCTGTRVAGSRHHGVSDLTFSSQKMSIVDWNGVGGY
jgi:hypothetical protein